jgi:hypothetical protein
MVIAEIPKDTLQIQLAKSLEVAERLYEILVEKPEVILDKVFNFPAGSPDQELLNYEIKEKYADEIITIFLIGRINNCHHVLIIENPYSTDVWRWSPAAPSFNDRGALFLRKGDRIKYVITGISETEPATGWVRIALIKTKVAAIWS